MNENQSCLIIGASHAGVSCAFALRRAGWKGFIRLIDSDPHLPYHRPPLSKAFLSGDDPIEKHTLRPEKAYENKGIKLDLAASVTKILPNEHQIELADDARLSYDKLVLATGARAWIPDVPGISDHPNVFTLRDLSDAQSIRNSFTLGQKKRVVIIGGGYIGLEVAASLRKMGGEVTVLEREDRVLSRVTAPAISTYFEHLHRRNGVQIHTQKNIIGVETEQRTNAVLCADGSRYHADLVIVGVGIRVNLDLARGADLTVTSGAIQVDENARTSNADIYAIGDCTLHFNPYYERFIRLESVQNAVDQGKIAAAAICGRDESYRAVPWFWSDQYQIKFQSVGLSEGYDQHFERIELNDQDQRSVWYFRSDKLLAVDAINHPKAYVLGTKVIKDHIRVNKQILMDLTQILDPQTLIDK